MKKKRMIAGALVALCMVLIASGAFLYQEAPKTGVQAVAADREDSGKKTDKVKSRKEKEEKKEEKTAGTATAKEDTGAESIAKKADDSATVAGTNGQGTASEASKSSGTAQSSTVSKSSNSTASSSSGSSSASKVSGSSSTPNASGSSSSSSTSSTSKPSKPAHTHNWQPRYQTTYKTVTDYEMQPVYENRAICNYCGKDITGNTDHIVWCGPNGEGASYSIKPVQTGTKQVAVGTHQEPAGQTVVGYTCSCGATK